MADPALPRTQPRRTLMADALVLLGLVVLGFFVSQLLGVLWAVYSLGGDPANIGNRLASIADEGDHGRNLLLAIQGLATLGTFVLPPLLLMLWVQRRSLWDFSPFPIRDNLELFWAILLIPALAPLLELTISWNKDVVLPDAFSHIEEWARAKEVQLAELTQFLISFSSFPQFLLGLLVVAILPAVGEELLFRGTIQPMLHRATGSPHRAIWLTAILFSAIHMQFFGFVPRMLLGALFGYLYYWSGNIWVPMLAHFTNNGLTVTLSYLSQNGQPDLDPENLPEAPLYVLVACALAGAAVLYRFRSRYFLTQEPFESSRP